MNKEELKTDKGELKDNPRIELINSLFECLDKEIEIYEIILKIVLQKQQFLIQNKELDLEKLLLDLNKLTEQAKYLDMKRLEILKKFGLDNKNLTWLENYLARIKNLKINITDDPGLLESFNEDLNNLVNSDGIPKTRLSEKDQRSITGDNVNLEFKNIPKNSFELIVKKTKKIKEMILKISEINNSNVFLIDQGRKNVKAYFDLLFKQFNNDTYSNVGIIQNKQYKNMLIDKVL